MTGTHDRLRPPRGEVRAALLRAARAEFDERGFHAASVEAIAARAGFTKGAVYGNFDGKFGLFLELQAEQTASVAALFDRASPSEDPETVLRAVAQVLVQVTLDPHMQLLLAEVRAHAAADPEQAAALGADRAALVDALTLQFSALAERLGLGLAVPAREATYLTLALSNGIALEHVGTPAPVVSADTVYRVLRAVFV